MCGQTLLRFRYLTHRSNCLGGKKLVTKTKRWYKDVGLGFKTPSEAITGTYIGACISISRSIVVFLSYCQTIDKKCPFTGDISIRGRILSGKVVSTKMTRTIIIRRDYLHYIPKYSTCRSAVKYSILLTVRHSRPL